MIISKKTLLVWITSCSALFINAQTKPSDAGFSGDTLKGFDSGAAYTESHNKHLDAKDQSGFILQKQRAFVLQKYNLPSGYLMARSITISPLIIPSCNNSDFETGDFTGWTGAIGYNSNSKKALTATVPRDSTLGANAAETSCSFHTLVNQGTDPYSGLPMVASGGFWSLRLGGENINLNSSLSPAPCTSTNISSYSSGEMLQQTFYVSPSNALFSYSSMVVFSRPVNGGHDANTCPYFRAEVLDNAGNPIPCLQYYIASDTIPAGPPPAGLLLSSISDSQGYPVLYSLWTKHSMDLSPYIGQNVTVRFTAAGCTYGGHFGYAYIDAGCSPLLVQVTGSACSGGTMTATAPAAGYSGSYSWQTLPTGTTGITGSTTSQTATINANGTYRVTITPSAGCAYTIDTTLTFKTAPVLTLQSTNPSCSPGNDGSVSATASGGNTPYTYSWSPAPAGGQGTAQITGLGGGTYTCTISSADGCLAVSTATLTNPGGLSSTATSSDATCFGSSNGIASASASGGTGPYNYSWLPTGGNSATATGLSAGTYTVVVHDNGNCQTSSIVVISQPTTLTNSMSFQNAGCATCTDGSATSLASGGKAPYTYSWSPGGGSTASLSNLSPGTYTCCITDANQCPQKCGTAAVSYSTGIAKDISSANTFTLYPNPFGSSFFVQAGLFKGGANLTVFDILGKQVLFQKILFQLTEINTSELPGGMYFVRISADGKTSSFKMIRN